MKARRVVVTVELETAVALWDLRESTRRSLAYLGEVLQVQANAIRGKKKGKK